MQFGIFPIPCLLTTWIYAGLSSSCDTAAHAVTSIVTRFYMADFEKRGYWNSYAGKYLFSGMRERC